MTIWTDSPPASDDTRTYQICRTPAKGKCRTVILSDSPVGVMLHYWKGRSTPCNRSDCEACKNGHRPRWKGYLYAMSERTRRIIIFEYPERPHPEVQAEEAKRKTLRGSILIAERTGTRPNSPVMISFEGTTPHLELLPTPTNLRETLERMWEVRQQPLDFLRANALAELPTNGTTRVNLK